MAVCRSVSQGANECSVWVLEGLIAGASEIDLQKAQRCTTHRILLLSSQLPRCLEVDTQERELALIILAHVLDSVDMEGHSKAVYREDNRLCFPIHKDLTIEISAHNTYVQTQTTRNIPSCSRLPSATRPHPCNS